MSCVIPKCIQFLTGVGHDAVLRRCMVVAGQVEYPTHQLGSRHDTGAPYVLQLSVVMPALVYLFLSRPHVGQLRLSARVVSCDRADLFSILSRHVDLPCSVPECCSREREGSHMYESTPEDRLRPAVLTCRCYVLLAKQTRLSRKFEFISQECWDEARDPQSSLISESWDHFTHLH